MFQIEIMITLILELQMEFLTAHSLAGLSLRPMELLAVLLENVVGSEVYSAPEPVVLHQLALRVYQLEVTEVRVRRRRHWVSRVDHDTRQFYYLELDFTCNRWRILSSFLFGRLCTAFHVPSEIELGLLKMEFSGRLCCNLLFLSFPHLAIYTTDHNLRYHPFSMNLDKT